MTDAQPEARTVPAWRPEDGPMRTRTWDRGGPGLEIRVEGEWRSATVLQRQDRRAGTVYAVVLIVPSVHATSACHRLYAWDPRAMRPTRAATTVPVERRYS